MSIVTSGKWWVGSEPADVREFLSAYSEDSYLIDQYRQSKCGCGSLRFQLEADDNEGVARRTCAKCGKQHFICDSEEFWADADPQHWACIECDSTTCNIGVGFAQYPDSATSIKWIYIGVRCSDCGILGCFAGWKVGQDDVAHLFDKA